MNICVNTYIPYALSLFVIKFKKKIICKVICCFLKGGLGGEKSRWMKAAESLQRDHDCLPGDVLISCGVIAYLSPFTSAYR